MRKRSDSRWEGRYTAGYDPVTGKRIIKNVLGKTQAEVKEKLKRAVEDNQKIDVAKDLELTVGQWAALWFENYAKPSIHENTAEYYRNYIEKHIIPRIGKIKLKNLTTQSKNLGNHSKRTSRNKRFFCQSAPQSVKAFSVKRTAFNPGPAFIILKHHANGGRIHNSCLGRGTPQKQLRAIRLRTSVQNIILYRRPRRTQQRKPDGLIRFALLHPDFSLPPVNVRQLQADDVTSPQARCRAEKDNSTVPLSNFRRGVDYIQNTLQLIIGYISLDGHLTVYPVGKQFHTVRGQLADFLQKDVKIFEIQKQIMHRSCLDLRGRLQDKLLHIIHGHSFQRFMPKPLKIAEIFADCPHSIIPRVGSISLVCYEQIHQPLAVAAQHIFRPMQGSVNA
ncbi:MAG: hypothetical protein HDT15_01850 [Oscillibacter sp.]|nr:hypothetical protein [Oscillibacter sp.]